MAGDLADVADSAIELATASALSQIQKQLGKQELKPRGCCYGCGEDFIVNGEVAPFFAGLGYSKEQMLTKVFCPNSAAECDGYYQVELRQNRIGGRA